MKRLTKCIAVVAAVTVLAGAVLLGLAAFVLVPRLLPTATRRVAEVLGRPVNLASLSVSLFPLPAVRLNGLEVGDDPSFGTLPFLSLDHADVRLRLNPLLHGEVEIDSIVLEQPHIRVINDAEGRLNVASLGTAQPNNAPPNASNDDAGAAAALLGARLQIRGGALDYVSIDSDGIALQYDLEDIALTLTAAPTIAFAGTARLQPGDIGVDIAAGSVALDGVPELGAAPIAARLTLDGRDVADLAVALFGPVPAVNGRIRSVLTLAGTLAEPTVSGDIEMPGVALTRTSPQCPAPQRRTLTLARLKLNAAWEDGRFMARPATAELGSGAITGSLVVTPEGVVRVEMADLTVTDLPLEKVLVDYFCGGYAVSGPLDLTGSLSVNAGTPRPALSSYGQLRIGPGEVVGPQALDLLAGIVRLGGAFSALLSADLPWSLFSSPLDFDAITATYQIVNGVLSIRDLLYVSSAMRITGGGQYTFADDSLNLELVINHGRGQVYAKVTGTGDDPSIHVTPTTILRDVDPGKIGHDVEGFLRRLF